MNLPDVRAALNSGQQSSTSNSRARYQAFTLTRGGTRKYQKVTMRKVAKEEVESVVQRIFRGVELEGKTRIHERRES